MQYGITVGRWRTGIVSCESERRGLFQEYYFRLCQSTSGMDLWGDDAAFCQITLTSCYIAMSRRLAPQLHLLFYINLSYIADLISMPLAVDIVLIEMYERNKWMDEWISTSCKSTVYVFVNVIVSYHATMALCATSDSKTFICDFHRKQAWLRWTSALKHKVADRQQEILALLNVSSLSCSSVCSKYVSVNLCNQ